MQKMDNQKDDKLISTEEVYLEQSNANSVSASENNGKTDSPERKKNKDKSLGRILLLCALLVVIAIPVLIVLTKPSKGDKEETVVEVNTQIPSIVDIPKEYPRIYRYSDADNKYVPDSLELNVANITGVYSFDDPQAISCMIGYEIKGIEYRLFTLKVEADSIEKHTNQLKRYADDENEQAIDSLYAFLGRNSHIDYVENRHYKGFVFVYDGCPDALKREWFSIGDYNIPIPETMYLSNDTNFGIKYNFMQKDPAKYARIQVKFDYDDYSYPASYFNNGKRLPLMEETSASIEIWQGMKEMGFEVLNLKGPDYINIDGEIVMKVGFDRKDPFPTHVDIYSFYLPNKCTTITTSYRIAEAKEWKSAIEASIIMTRKKKNK